MNERGSRSGPSASMNERALSINDGKSATKVEWTETYRALCSKNVGSDEGREYGLVVGGGLTAHLL